MNRCNKISDKTTNLLAKRGVSACFKVESLSKNCNILDVFCSMISKLNRIHIIILGDNLFISTLSFKKVGNNFILSGLLSVVSKAALLLLDLKYLAFNTTGDLMYFKGCC